MSRGFPVDNQKQAALTSRFKKENDAQLRWYIMQKESGVDPGSQGSKHVEVLKRRVNAPVINKRMKNLMESYKPPRYNMRTINFDEEILKKLNLKNFSEFKEMRPPSPKTEEILYDGFTKEGKGRGLYLKTRNKDSPDSKFEFPVLSSMEYGWKLHEVIKKEDIKKPTFSRTQLIAHTFYRNNGIPIKHNHNMLMKDKSIF